MAILASDASFDEFCLYVRGIREDVHVDELQDLWEWREKLLGLTVATGRGFRAQLPPDEQHLTREQRGRKTAAEAKANGRNLERLPDKVYF